MNQIQAMVDALSQRTKQYEIGLEKQYALWVKDVCKKPPLLLTQTDFPDLGFEPFSHNMEVIQSDDEKMLYEGLKSAVRVRADGVPSVRANKGCGVYPNLLGVRSTYFEDKMPWVLEHLDKKQLSAMEPDQIKLGDEFKRGLETMAYMADRLKGTLCRVYPLDLQGAVDTAHVVYGDAFFYDLYDDPTFIHHLLELSTQAIIKGCEEVLTVLEQTGQTQTNDKTYICHYNGLIMPKSKGGIKFSEDTTTLLNPSQIDEFCLPYLERLLQHFGGGYVHYCGKNDHLYQRVIQSDAACGINFGNPSDMHDMDQVLLDCVKHKKIYYGAPGRTDESESFAQYYERCLTNAYDGNKFHIILSDSCQSDQVDSVLQAFELATAAAMS